MTEVVATRIESTRLGTLDWSLLVDCAYEVGGARHENIELNVFHDVDRAVTEEARNAWPVGRRFTIFVHPDDPRSVSRVADGGRQAAAVVAALLTPLALAFATFATLLVRRSRTAKRRSPAR